MKPKKVIVAGAVIVVIISIIGFTINGIKIKDITKRTQQEIEVEKKEIAKKQQELQELQTEFENIDSPEYIKKIAEEQLGMVEDDTIVFREKNK